MVGIDTYPHTLLVQEASSEGGQDGDGGYNPGGNVVDVYNGPCDAQEKGSSGLTITTSDGSVESTSADLEIFLKDESKIYDLKVDMTGTLTRGPKEEQIRIVEVRVLDGMIETNTI